VLARLLLDKLLPEDIHRIIYLDGDTIVRGDFRKYIYSGGFS
jgi:lipopolysaccharide biosynthesis glycosyltransferase